MCECRTKKIWTETWYLNLHLEFKQQLRLWAAKENLHKVSIAAVYEW